MPVITSNEYKIAIPHVGENEVFSKELNTLLSQTFLNRNLNETSTVAELLKVSFKFIEDKFMELINLQTEASFFLFVHNFHENSCALWERKIQKLPVDIQGHELSTVRRVYKIILEQGCKLELVGTTSFQKQIFDKRFEYLSILEDLLFLGSWAIHFSEFISKNKLYSKSVSVELKDDTYINKIDPNFEAVINHYQEQLDDHNKDVVICQTLEELKEIFSISYNIDYDTIFSFIENKKEYRVSFSKLEDFINNLSENHKYDIKTLNLIFNGLTIHKDNAMSFENCIIRNQEINRYICKPLMILFVDKQPLYLVGYHKWKESLTYLSYNCFPFGIYPLEWKDLLEVKQFMSDKNNKHDKVLENALINILNQNNYKNDNNVGSIFINKGKSIPIRKLKGVGEIDLIFIDELKKKLYICECKHNRSKFDFAGWYRDHMSFKKDYEAQLLGKINWAKDNVNIILGHLENKYKVGIDNKEEYTIEGIFLINAPTLYIYDSVYPTYTIYLFKKWLLEKEILSQFILENSVTGEQTKLIQPFLTNIELMNS